jgi:hypothetical protein
VLNRTAIKREGKNQVVPAAAAMAVEVALLDGIVVVVLRNVSITAASFSGY